MASIEGTNPGYYGRINWFIDATDDPLLGDGTPSFEGGQFSNLRANLLQQNQSTLLMNCDIDRLGKLRTRRGTILIGKGATPQPDPGVLSQIQGLTSYQTPDNNYVVAAHNKKIWKYTGSVTAPHVSGWEQIAIGGVADQADMLFYREGLINQPGSAGPPVVPPGYTAGTTVLTVDHIGYVGMSPTGAGGAAPAVSDGGVVGAGDKLYFTNNLRTEWFEYTIASENSVAGASPTTQITLEEPGLVFDVKDNWKFVVARPAKNVGVHLSPTGTPYTGTLTIVGYASGIVNPGETFIIKSENVKHKVTTATGSPTTAITAWTNVPASPVGLQTDFIAHSPTIPIIFAEGNNLLFISDGTGPIFAWDGNSLMNLSQMAALDYLTGSALSQTQTAAPQNVSIMVWFQNRLIVSGIPTEPDAIYFSDFFDPTSWDHFYQKIRIGGGESDPITGLLAWSDYNMLVFKKNSIYVINLNPQQSPDPNDPTLLVASYAVQQIHKLIGCPAPQTAQQVGGGSTSPGSDVFFVDGDKKVHSVRRVLAAETQQEVGTAVSLPIQDVLDTINLTNIGTSVAMYHNEHYILGIPSTRLPDGGLLPNEVVAYNLLTQSWCGIWTWAPTCFSRRTDLGSYSKLIFGDSVGNVVQWMDDIGLDDETDTSYQDLVNSSNIGITIPTQIITRSFTGGDFYSNKTGINVEFEFDESAAEAVHIVVFLDKVRKDELVAPPFNTLTEPRLRLLPAGAPGHITVPFTLPGSPGLMRRAFDLQRYGTWRELYFNIHSNADPELGVVGGKLAIRSIRVTFFMDTYTLQTIPIAAGGVFEPPLTLPPVGMP